MVALSSTRRMRRAGLFSSLTAGFAMFVLTLREIGLGFGAEFPSIWRRFAKTPPDRLVL
jgi:hypothetical protein